MVFVACGLNHKSAPLVLREKFAVPPAMQNIFLQRLVDSPVINEAAVLSTCNRTEIYCDTSDSRELATLLAQEYQLPTDVLLPCFYMHQGNEGIRHTFRVASGLDSMMLGEPQIFGQLKKAYQQACHAGTAKTNLRHVFEYVFSAGKRIRSRSGIGSCSISVAYTAVQLLGQLHGDYRSLRVFLIGSGETSTLVAKYLQKAGVQKFFIASRTREHAVELATTLNGEALTIGDIPQYLAEADVVISATACPLPFINKSLVEHALNQRNQAPMVFFDLAVPRDIEENVGELENVRLFNIDDLQGTVDRGMKQRRSAALQAEQLIEYELDNYISWHRSLRADQVICDYRTRMQSLAQNELRRSLARLSAGSISQESVLKEFCDRLVNKLTHIPTVGLKQAARDNRAEILDLAQYLFNPSVIENSYEEIT